MKQATSIKIIRIIGILLTINLCMMAMGKLDCFPFIELILIIIFLIVIGPVDYKDFGKFKAYFTFIPPEGWRETVDTVTLDSISKNVTVSKYENSGKKTMTTSRSYSRSGNKIYGQTTSTTTYYRAEAYYFKFESEDEANAAENEIIEMYEDVSKELQMDFCRYKSELVVYRYKYGGSGPDKDEVKRVAESGTIFKSQETPSLDVARKYQIIIYGVSLILLLMISFAMAYTFDFTSLIYLSSLIGAIAVIAYAAYINRNATSKANTALIIIIIASVIRLASVWIWLDDFYTIEYLIPLIAVLMGGVHLAYKKAYKNYLEDIS